MEDIRIPGARAARHSIWRSSIPRSWILVVSLLTVLTGALFVAATAVERSAAVQAHTEAMEGSESSGEQSAHREAAEASEGRVLGLNLEAPWVPWVVIAETVIVVLLLVFFGLPALFVVILLAIAGTILDVRELVHQAAASRVLLVTLVSATAASRIAAVVVSLVAIVLGLRGDLRGGRPDSAQT